jgi:high-affinity nickel permease
LDDEMTVVVFVDGSVETLELLADTVELKARVRTRELAVGETPEDVGVIVVKTVVVTYRMEVEFAEADCVED